jgi:hypothetical protein
MHPNISPLRGCRIHGIVKEGMLGKSLLERPNVEKTDPEGMKRHRAEILKSAERNVDKEI